MHSSVREMTGCASGGYGLSRAKGLQKGSLGDQGEVCSTGIDRTGSPASCHALTFGSRRAMASMSTVHAKSAGGSMPACRP